MRECICGRWNTGRDDKYDLRIVPATHYTSLVGDLRRNEYRQLTVF